MQVTLKSRITFLYNKELVHPQKLNWLLLELSSEDVHCYWSISNQFLCKPSSINWELYFPGDL